MLVIRAPDVTQNRSATRPSIIYEIDYLKRHVRVSDYMLRRRFDGSRPSSDRYLATVRRASGMPRSLRILTISWSESGLVGLSREIKSWMASFTLVFDITSPLAVW